MLSAEDNKTYDKVYMKVQCTSQILLLSTEDSNTFNTVHLKYLTAIFWR